MICGHQKIIQALGKNIKNKRLSHAYLFLGPENLGKKLVAINFAKTMQCKGKEKPCNQAKLGQNQAEFDNQCQTCFQIDKNIHPDTTIFQKQGEIKISETREIQQKMSLKSYSSPYKILILDDAENLNENSANSILKFLEEPKGDTIIVLISSDIKRILPTIISRCTIIKFFPVAKKKMLEYFRKLKKEIPKNLSLEELINYSLGRPGKVISWLKDPSEFLENKKIINNFGEIILKGGVLDKFRFVSKFYSERSDGLFLLDKLILLYRDLLLLKAGQRDLVNVLSTNSLENLAKKYKIDKIEDDLKKLISAKKMILGNINLKLILENIILNL